MEKQFSPHIEDEIKLSRFQHIIFVNEVPYRLDRCVVCICIEGSANIFINSVKQIINKQEMIILFPNQIILSESISNDFLFEYLTISRNLLGDIIFRFPPNFIGYLRENPHCILQEKAFDSIHNDFFRIVDERLNDIDNICRSEIIINIIRNFFLDTYNHNFNNLQNYKKGKKRKHELIESFINLLMAHYTDSREVAFYAEKLCITPKYLSMVLKEQNGNTAKQWIDNHVVTEIKLLLKSTNLSIQEIAYKLNFPNQSFLCKYFKAHTSVSPTSYKTTK